MPETESRLVGSGFTTLSWNGQPLGWLDGFDDSGVGPVADPQVVQPIGWRRPREIATARAVGAGTLAMTLRELWNEPVWWQLTGLAGTWDIVDVYEALAAMPPLTAQMLIKPPGGRLWRGKNYHGLIIVSIADNETVRIGSLTFPRIITAMYTHTTPVSVAA